MSGMEKVSVGKLLKPWRVELSLTQRQVANQVGVTEATVSRWESGDIDNMRRDKIAGLASALRVSPLLIMGMDDAEQFYKPVNSDELELLDDYREVPDEDKSIVRIVLKRLKFGRGQSVNQAVAIWFRGICMNISKSSSEEKEHTIEKKTGLIGGVWFLILLAAL